MHKYYTSRKVLADNVILGTVRDTLGKHGLGRGSTKAQAPALQTTIPIKAFLFLPRFTKRQSLDIRLNSQSFYFILVPSSPCFPKNDPSSRPSAQ